MQRVLDPPMPSDIASILLGFPRLAADGVTHVGSSLLPGYSPLAYHHADRPQVLPQGLIPNPAGPFHREALAPPHAAGTPPDPLSVPRQPLRSCRSQPSRESSV